MFSLMHLLCHIKYSDIALTAICEHHNANCWWYQIVSAFYFENKQFSKIWYLNHLYVLTVQSISTDSAYFDCIISIAEDVFHSWSL